VRRILILDADAALARAVARVTSPEVFAIDLAAPGPAALGAVRDRTDLVFLRVKAGPPAAVSLVAGLRRLRPRVPIVVVAAQASAADELALRRAGILCYLEEPLADDMLRSVVLSASPCCGVV
jgi:DNA-binding response OmpR family regulator